MLRRICAAVVLAFLVAALGAPVASALFGDRETCAEACADDCPPGCQLCTCAHRPLSAVVVHPSPPRHADGPAEITATPRGHLLPGIHLTPYRPPRA